jgi:multidrug efflux pump
MTSVSTVGGTLPLVLATGAGAESRQPLGIVIVGGMTIATVLTLFVVPVFYLLFDRIIRGLTGRSSAHGLRRAANVEAEIANALPSEK